MTDPGAEGSPAVADEQASEDAAWRLRDIAAELDARGLVTRLRDGTGLPDLDVRATRPGRWQPAAIIDPDGYVELRFWTARGASAAQVATYVARILAAAATTG